MKPDLKRKFDIQILPILKQWKPEYGSGYLVFRISPDADSYSVMFVKHLVGIWDYSFCVYIDKNVNIDTIANNVKPLTEEEVKTIAEDENDTRIAEIKQIILNLRKRRFALRKEQLSLEAVDEICDEINKYLRHGN